jgi:hypothetical protein
MMFDNVISTCDDGEDADPDDNITGWCHPHPDKFFNKSVPRFLLVDSSKEQKFFSLHHGDKSLA